MEACRGFEVAYLVAIRATALLGGAALVDLMIERVSPARRHALWAGSLGGALTLPFLDRMLPAWHLGVLGLPARAPAAPLMWAVVTTWALGAMAILGHVIRGHTALRRLIRETVPAPRAWAEPRVPMSPRRVTIRLGPDRLPPFTHGALRPIVVLPRAALRWPDARRAAVLGHELAHVRRVDEAWDLLGWAARALLWFHPLAWIAARRLGRAREQACDEAAVATGLERADYAAHVFAVVQEARHTPPAGMA